MGTIDFRAPTFLRLYGATEASFIHMKWFDENEEIRIPETDQNRQDISNAMAELNSSSGVVILSEMFGGTPSNLTISSMNESSIEAIAGVNLPMLIKLASLREGATLAEAAAGAKLVKV